MKQVVYTASPESHQIHAWQLHDDGALTLLQVVDAPGQVQPMVVSPDKAFLYVGVRPDFRVVAYKIDAEGKLKEAGHAPLLAARRIFLPTVTGALFSWAPITMPALASARLLPMACRVRRWRW